MKRGIILTVVALVAIGGGWWYLRQNPEVQGEVLRTLRVRARLSAAPAEDGWVASGFIEAEEVIVAPEIGGRIATLPVDEGDEVQAGDLLLHLEDDLLLAQVELARAKLEEAQAMLAQAEAGARQETIDKVEAQLALAQAARDGAKQAWLDAQRMRDNPQELDAQITAARAEVTKAQKELEAMLLQRDVAEIAWKQYGKGVDKLARLPSFVRENFHPGLPPEFYLIPYQWNKALTATEAAQAAYDGARSALDHLLAQRSNPQEARAQVDAAYARYQSAEAAVAQVQAALDGARAGATKEQIEAARAQVELAQAALEAAQVQLDKATVLAPMGGVVVARSVYTGELAAPGLTAMTLADLDDVTLTIYVPGSHLGEVDLGQTIDVYLDAFEDLPFPGKVVYISDQAEYTPRNVRTPDQRGSLVYAVKIKIPNPDHTLKPGMQAEVKVAR